MDYDKIQLYIYILQDALKLQAWDIFVAQESADDECHASIHFTSGRRVAYICLHPEWGSRSDSDKRQDLVHELLHVFHHDTDDNLFQSLHASGDLSRYVVSILIGQTSRDLERMVDSLTNVIAPFLPPWED